MPGGGSSVLVLVSKTYLTSGRRCRTVLTAGIKGIKVFDNVCIGHVSKRNCEFMQFGSTIPFS